MIPGSERSSERGHGNPLQHSCHENPIDRGAWRAKAHGVAESDTSEAVSMRVQSLLQGAWESDHTHTYDGNARP